MNSYTKDDIKVIWKPRLCIHSGNCARGLPSVFKPREKPWVDTDGASKEDIIRQVGECPSGALSVEKTE